MKKFLLFFISFLLGVSLIVWIYRQIDLKEVFLHCRFLIWPQIFLLFLLTLGKIITWVFRWKMILKEMGFSHLPFWFLFRARLGEMSLSYITPGMYCGGEVVRIFVLKKNNKITLLQGLASVFYDRIAEITSFGVFAFFGALVFLSQFTALPILVALIVPLLRSQGLKVI